MKMKKITKEEPSRFLTQRIRVNRVNDIAPVIGLLFESQRSAIVEVSGKFNGSSFTKNFDWSGHLLLRYS